MTGLASNLAADKNIIRNPDNLADLNAWSRLWEPLRGASIPTQAQNLDRFVKFMSVVENSVDRELISLLKSARSLQTTDPRDKVFAVLNIANDGESFPSPDYALTKDEVYRLYAQVLAERGHAVELLSLSLFRGESQTRLTWVPRWNVPTPEFNFELCTRFNAGGNRISPCYYIDGHFMIKAYHLDCITYRSTAFTNIRSFLRDLAARIDDFLLSNPYSTEHLSINPIDPSRDLLDLLFCDWPDNKTQLFWDTHPWKNGSDLENLQRMRVDWCHGVGSYGTWNKFAQVSYWETLGEKVLELFGKKPSVLHDFKKKLLDISPTEELLQGIASSNADPRFLKYLRGDLMPLCLVFGSCRGKDRSGLYKRYIGFAHATCIPGDRIVLVKGARAPYIFRKIGPEQYQNLGQAYIRGIMKGEVAETLDRKDWDYVVVA